VLRQQSSFPASFPQRKAVASISSQWVTSQTGFAVRTPFLLSPDLCWCRERRVNPVQGASSLSLCRRQLSGSLSNNPNWLGERRGERRESIHVEANNFHSDAECFYGVCVCTAAVVSPTLFLDRTLRPLPFSNATTSVLLRISQFSYFQRLDQC
jgi:hypothetical protein